MLYLANASSVKVRKAMYTGELGQIVTPNERRLPLAGVTWAADNGCFSTRYVGDDKWLAWLSFLARLFVADFHRERRHPSTADFVRLVDFALFATAPDVLSNAQATLERSAPFLPIIRALGYKAALVGQDGLEDLDVPWDDFDWLFLGGGTEWKLSDAAATLTREARARGKGVHMGRVNSRKRWRYAESVGCDTADGTFLAFGPDTNLPRFRMWTAPEISVRNGQQAA